MKRPDQNKNCCTSQEICISICVLLWLGMKQFYPYDDDIIKWKHFPHYWPFVQGIHQSPLNSPHKGQRCGTLIFSLIWTNGWVNYWDASDLRCHRAHYDVTVMSSTGIISTIWITKSLWYNHNKTKHSKGITHWTYFTGHCICLL